MYYAYNDFKVDVHKNGATIQDVANVMRISPKTIKRMFDREVSKERIYEINDAIKEASKFRKW